MSETPQEETPRDSEELINQPEWDEWDAAYDREEGPFDISEVDLDADDVQRIDLGSLVLTPFPEMKMQIQVDRAKQVAQAILVADGQSALEVAVFAGPTRTSMVPEVRSDIIAGTRQANGLLDVVEGPFGAELRRRMPVTTAEGNLAMHVSRTWLASGPGWILRGVLMGKGALEPDNEDAVITLFEFFSNLVVRRGPEPAAPGTVLPLTIPQGAAPVPGADAAEA